MADKFDPYREALVMETAIDWPEEYEDLPVEDLERISVALHADAANCGQIEYVRTHTGFCRKITPSVEEIEAVS